jgi:PleD family two-component response regulator
MSGLLAISGIFAALFKNAQKITGKPYQLERKNPREKPIAKNKPTPILLLVGNSQIRDYLSSLLAENNYSPLLMTDPEELLHSLKDKQFAIILMDCSAVTSYGTRILSKIRVSCRLGRIIIFCDKEHLHDKLHRELIKEVLNIGVYACILAPYKEWEVLSMFTYYP